MKPYNPKSSIKYWASDDRPREKLLNHGKSMLSNAELMAILIGSGTRKLSAIELSKLILSASNNNLNELANLSVEELKKFNGIGEAKAITLIAAFELGRRKQASPAKPIQKITSSKDAYALMASALQDQPIEEFWVVYLNQNNRVITKSRISVGGISGTVADSRVILKKALHTLASSIILFHNHPSGNIQPSMADKQLTKKLSSAAELMQIKVLDHLIISGDLYFSFADEGILN